MTWILWWMLTADASVCSLSWRGTASCNGPGFGIATFVAETVYESDGMQSYACETKPHTGAERIVRFSCDYDTLATVVMSNTRCDLDLFVIDATCDPGDIRSCEASNQQPYNIAQGAAGQYSVQFLCLSGLEYYLVVENRVSSGPSCGVLLGDYNGDGIASPAEQGQGSNFFLTPSCVETCGDGYDNDRDGTTDCDDSECLPECCDRDLDGVWANTAACGFDGDCDDNDPDISPQVEEMPADGTDQDCDGVDACFVDFDRDGIGGAAFEAGNDLDCTDPIGESTRGDDCDDTLAAIFPGAIEGIADGVDQDCTGTEACWRDADGDHHGVPQLAVSADLTCEVAGTASVADDCADNEVGVYPGAAEVVADGVDQDCDGVDDCYVDDDGDGWGTSVALPGDDLVCGGGDGYAPVPGDCADSAAEVHPTAVERCNGVDDDCDGLIDGFDPGLADAATWYIDHDRDGYGAASTTVAACAAPPGYVEAAGDCDDAVFSVRPGAPEAVADGVDQDCDGQDLCWLDQDGDGHGGSGTLAGGNLACGDAPAESLLADDCADVGPGAAAIYPGASEVCGGVDDDCDGLVDDADPGRQGGSTYFFDADGDGYFGTTTVVACTQPVGLGLATDDCRDAGPGAVDVHPGAPELAADGVDQDCDGVDACFVDLDGDGFGGATTAAGDNLVCGDAAGEAADAADCVDAGAGAATIFPGAIELCDGLDDDCDALIDDADPDRQGGTAWYVDLDGDRYAGPTSALACVQPPGSGLAPVDCRDSGPGAEAVFPGAVEAVADSVDQDCDGVDACYVDADLDSFGGVTSAPGDDLLCGDAAGESATSTDCLDVGPGAAAVFPGAIEVCDGVDNDCDSRVDDADDPVTGTQPWYGDNDGDGFAGDLLVVRTCSAPPGYVGAVSDCDDARSDRSPAALELCNGFDDDCDGLVDDADIIVGGQTGYVDSDGDGAGDPSSSVVLATCGVGPGFSLTGDDCDDGSADVRPGGVEVPYDGVDQDCSGADLDDVDQDGFVLLSDCDDRDAGRFPGALELADGVDEDCDRVVDEGTARGDDDGDGFTELGGDCDDAATGVHPGAAEACDAVDQDCDGANNEGTPCADDDGDGLSEEQGDCADGDATIHPGAAEGRPGVDSDCDGVLRSPDPDGDGYGVDGGDCAEGDAARHPGADELVDGVDQDCDGVADEGTASSDDDGDGLSEVAGDCWDGERTTAPTAPELPANGRDDDCDGAVDEGGDATDDDHDGYPEDGGDCDDADPLRRPGLADDDGDGVDQDCDGVADDGASDLDGDGFTAAEGDCDDRNGFANPEAPETCDGVDNDCDRVIDLDGCGVVDTVTPPPDDGGGCGCATGASPTPTAFALAGLALLRRRRR